MPEAHSLLKDLGVQVTSGHRLLGGIIASEESLLKISVAICDKGTSF